MTDTVRVSPTVDAPTHHLSLTDGTTTIGLILATQSGKIDPNGLNHFSSPKTTMRMSSGEPKYGDYQMPYTPVVQDDFISGRGQRYLEDDKTRYLDAYRCDTSNGRVLRGPRVHRCDLLGTHQQMPTTGAQTRVISYVNPGTTDYAYLAWKFTAAHAFVRPVIFIRQATTTRSKPTELGISIYSDDGGTPSRPDTQLAIYAHTNYFDTQNTSNLDPSYSIYTIATDVNLSAGTDYWIVAAYIDVTDPPIIELVGGPDGSALANGIVTASLLGTWTDHADAGSYSIWFEMVDQGVKGKQIIFFEYLRQLYAVVSYDDLATKPKLFINGYRGLATSNAADLTKINTGLTLTANELAGCIALVISGPGSAEKQPWRKITSNTTAGVCTVSEAWIATHTTSTCYVILGTDVWTEIDWSATMTAAPVTDVCVYNDIAYFCQSEDNFIKRMNEYNNSGTWTRRFAAESAAASKATFLEAIPIPTGGYRIWGASKVASTAKVSVTKTWADGDLAFGSDIVCGTTSGKITNLLAYGDPQIPYILKEDEIGSIENNIYSAVPIPEMRNVKNESNGRAALHYGVYLFFSMLGGLERYYESRLDDVGPNRDDGLPPGRIGDIQDLVSYPGKFYASIDAGSSGASSILLYNNLGWHEIYREAYGLRAGKMFIQSVPGDCDRLWFSMGATPNYIHAAVNPLEKGSDYDYHWMGVFDTSWITVNMRDIKKYWHKIKLFKTSKVQYTEITGNYTRPISPHVWYRTRPGAGWTYIGQMPEQTDGLVDDNFELDLYSTTYNQSFNIQFRFATFKDADAYEIMDSIEAIRVDAITRIPPSSGLTAFVMVKDHMADLQGTTSELTASQIETQLVTWANSDQRARPLVMRSTMPLWDNKIVFIDPPSLKPLKSNAITGASAGNAKREHTLVGELLITVVE